MTEPCKHEGWQTYHGEYDARLGINCMTVRCNSCGAVLLEAPMQIVEAMTKEREKAEEIVHRGGTMSWESDDSTDLAFLVSKIESALIAAKAEERERCAKIADAYDDPLNGCPVGGDVAAEIRAGDPETDVTPEERA